MIPAEEWGRCRHWIEASLEHSPVGETIEDVEQSIRDSIYQFWPGHHSAVITEIVEFKHCKAMIVRHAGGDLDEIIEMEKTFCAFAKAQGCTRIMGEGRDGWKPVCKRMGYRLASIAMIKDLT